MQVAILAGGLATRLRPKTDKIPKSMILINGKPFLEYQITFLKEGGFSDFVICSGYLSEQIEDYFGDGKKFGVNIQYSNDGDKLLGTGGALKNAEKLLNDEFFVIYGDSYVSLDFKNANSHFKKSGKLVLMTVYKNDNLYDISNIAVENGIVIKYDKKNNSKDLVYIDYGVLIFNKKVLEKIPANQSYPLENLIINLIEDQEVCAYETKERFYEIGSHTGLDEFKNFISQINNE
ncbi:sugar phosphate nucleotidyltransferase [Methanolacinia paynteri]|uniref:sugar phosphate nucleotidyltransferase n=1 Tax=Methanolacinia paynteri TaxID=230356 RepID=UPI00064F2286|nr:sugar phosphate nucleotidyltransferase [Methanolacinia paynteri]